MHAVVMTAPGGPEVLSLTECPEPEIVTPTQVKVRLSAAGVNPIDTKLRARGVFYPDALPAILGCDGAGVVVKAGAQAGIAVGTRVAFCHGGLGGVPGNYAQFTVIEAAEVVSVPEAVDDVEAAALPLALITAWESLIDRARLRAEQTVLVIGGAGGVGHLAVQLACLHGARVLATAGSDENAAFLRDLGVEAVIRHDQEPIAQAAQRLTEGRGVDVTLDAVGGHCFGEAIAATTYAGDVVTLHEPPADAPWKEARRRNLRVSFDLMLTPMLSPLPEARARQIVILRHGLDWVAEGRLRVEIAAVLPLEQAGEAHRRVGGGHTRGKLVLQVT